MGNLFDSSPRGIRNNNWLNIKFNPRSMWQGLAGNDGTFCIFQSPEYGIRAAHKIMKNYLKRDSKMSISEMIHRWCPDDSAKFYTEYVCRNSGILPWLSLYSVTQSFSLFVQLISCMAEMENGKHSLPSDYVQVIREGLSMKI